MYRIVAVIILQCLVIATCQNVNCKEPPPMVDSDTCCPGASLIDDAVIEKCMRSFDNFDSPPVEACFAECLFNETKLMANRQLDKAATEKLITTKLSPNLQTIARTVINGCTETAESKKAELAKTVQSDQYTCSLLPLYLMKCTCAGVFKACPADLFQSTNEECKAKKSYVESCPVEIPVIA